MKAAGKGLTQAYYDSKARTRGGLDAGAHPRSLEGFGEFFSKGALRSVGALTLVLLAASTAAIGTSTHSYTGVHSGTGLLRTGKLTARNRTLFGLGRLSGICTKKAVFKRRAVESADDGLHLFRVRSFDEREALRLLRLGVTDYFNAVGNQVFCGEPRLDVVGSHPDRKISKKNGGTHSVGLFTS